MTDVLNSRFTLWSLMALAILLFAVANLPWHLDDYDQAKQAFTSFEMVKQGHWFYQHAPNGWVATKPPLVGWFSTALFAATRSWDLAWRLPSFLASVALLFLIARAASVYGFAEAFMAACAFSLNLFTPRLATLVRTDVPLALVLFVIGWMIWEKIRKREAWTRRDRFWMFVLLSVAMMIKGPIIYAFLLPPMVAFKWRARTKVEKMTAWFGWWPWVASFEFFLAWVIGGTLFVSDFFENVVMREFAWRFSGAVHQSQPIYFYLPHFVHRFAPWSVLLIFLAVLAVRENKWRIRGWLRELSPETFWLLAWAFGGLLVMSLIPSKRIDRIFPIVPPLCLLLAVLVNELRANEKLRRLTEVGCATAIVFACVLTTGYVGQRIVVGYRQQSDALVAFGKTVRQEAAAHGWTYKIVDSDDEGMLLYLRLTEFVEPNQAVDDWKDSRVDGLVVSTDDLDELLPRLPGAVPSEIGMSKPAGRNPRRYVFLVRS